LKITATPEVVWEKCALDIVGPLCPTLDGNKYVLTFQYELSKYTLAIPVRQQDAPTIARVFVEEVILKFGIPQMVLTDQGSNFMSEVFTNICKLLKKKNKMHFISTEQLSFGTYPSCSSRISPMLYFGRPK
jgi:hypothetical protein